MADSLYWLQNALQYQWLEDSLRLGEKIPEDSYGLKFDSAEQANNCHDDEAPEQKRMKSFPGKKINGEGGENKTNMAENEASDVVQGSDKSFHTPSPEISGSDTLDDPNKAVKFCYH